MNLTESYFRRLHEQRIASGYYDAMLRRELAIVRPFSEIAALERIWALPAAKIQQVKDAIAAGTVSEADLARLDALSGQLTGSLTDLQADDAPPPTP